MPDLVDKQVLLERIYNLHLRLRLRNPATDAEVREFREVLLALRTLFPDRWKEDSEKLSKEIRRKPRQTRPPEGTTGV